MTFLKNIYKKKKSNLLTEKNKNKTKHINTNEIKMSDVF